MPSKLSIEFDPEKSAKLKAERGIGFDEIIALLDSEQLLEIIEHPNSAKYPRQKVFVINIDGYIHWVPFVRTGNTIFLKTIFPTRDREADMKNLKLDTEEQELFDSLEKGEWKPVKNQQEEIVLTKAAAQNFMKKDARINIRVSQFDLNRIKRIAAHEGLPYQTLIASILHKFAAARV